MRRRICCFAALCVSAVAFCGTVPPAPRDGEGRDISVVPILIYHAVRPYKPTDTRAVKRYIATPHTLESELVYLRQNDYTSISFDDLANHLLYGTPLPPKPVIISFDDGWEWQYTYALPLLKQYRFTATFYIQIGAVGRRNYLSWDEVRGLAAAGMQIGSHTFRHPCLTRVRREETLRREIIDSKKELERRIGAPVTTFAYPYGQYNARVASIVRDAGYTTARSTWPGIVHSHDGLMTLTGLIRTDTEARFVSSLNECMDALPGAAENIPIEPPPIDRL